jgi:hypothetical protein
MANITPTAMSGDVIVRTTVETTLTASDTLPFDASRQNGILLLRNPTGGALSPTITGNTAPTAYPVRDAGVINLAAGLAVGSIPAGQSRVIPLDKMKAYLSGTITITGGTGLVAAFLQY